MEKLGYHWADTPSGQYIDGHEHADVVKYQWNVFLPAWFAKEHQLHIWTEDNIDKPATASDHEKHDVAWVHNETIFHANDHH